MSSQVTTAADVNSTVDSPDLAADLQRRVKNFIWQSQRPALRKVDVRVDHGTVTLSGTLPSFHTRQLCLSFCQRVAGVIRVIDNMDVDWEDPTGI